MTAEPDLTPVSDAPTPPPAPAHTIVTPALEPIKWPKKKEDGKPFKLSLPPQKVWEYRLADGSLYGVVARWDNDNGKVVLPCVCVQDGDKVRWAWHGFGDKPGCRPLLGLMELATKPLATVLVVEGEKTKDAAPRWMPEDWVCVTWQGGSKTVRFADWRPLAGRRVVIWPDKDAAPIDPKTGQVRVDGRTGKAKLPAGEETARELLLILSEMGAGVALVPVYGPTGSVIPSNGWDLADTPPEGFNPTEWMVKAASFIQVPEARREAPAIDPPAKVNGYHPPQDEEPDLRGKAPPDIEHQEYRCLGYSQRETVPVFHIFSARSGFIVTQSAKELCNRNGVYNIVPNDPYWREHMPYLKDVEKLPWHHIGGVLMNKCYDAGYFQIDNERGRGAWLDDGRVVMHLGQTLIVDGSQINPTSMASDYYYPVSASLFKPKGVPALTDDEGRLLRKICRTIRWQQPFFAELMGGWLATAPVCGAMPWRTHFWVQGSAGSGKSWIVDNVVKPCFGKLGFYPMGNSSAAGIMGELRRDARPVVFDEAEGKGQRGIERRDMIIEMLRYSSSEGDGNVVKGTAGHGTVSFRVQSQYFLSSIGVGLQDQADQTRIVVCGLKAPNPHDGSFLELKNLIKKLPKDLPERLLRRQLLNLRTIRENADMLAQVIALQIGSRRIGDQIGTLMAGDFSLTSSNKLTYPQAEELVQARMTDNKLTDFSKIQEAGEDVDLLEHLASSMVRVTSNHGYGVDRSLGELFQTAAGRLADDKIDMVMADTCLRRIGCAYERIDDVAGFWIARTKTYIATEIMRRSQFAQGWDLVLKNHPMAKVSKEQKSFGGFKLFGIWLPLSVLMGEHRAGPIDEAE